MKDEIDLKKKIIDELNSIIQICSDLKYIKNDELKIVSINMIDSLADTIKYEIDML